MSMAATRTLELRTRIVRNPETGKILEKPKAPGMREIVKGAWNYGEAPFKSEEPNTKMPRRGHHED